MKTHETTVRSAMGYLRGARRQISSCITMRTTQRPNLRLTDIENCTRFPRSWQVHGKFMARWPRQDHGKIMARTTQRPNLRLTDIENCTRFPRSWQVHGKFMARWPRQDHGKIMARSWQVHGKFMESPEHAQCGIFAVVVVNCTLVHTGSQLILRRWDPLGEQVTAELGSCTGLPHPFCVARSPSTYDFEIFYFCLSLSFSLSV